MENMSSKEINDALEMDQIKTENAEYDLSQRFEVTNESVNSFHRPPFYMMFVSPKKELQL